MGSSPSASPVPAVAPSLSPVNGATSSWVGSRVPAGELQQNAKLGGEEQRRGDPGTEERQHDEVQYATAPAATQVAPQAMNHLMGDSLSLMGGPFNPPKPSWADVVRRSGENSSGPFEENDKGSCRDKISIPALEGSVDKRSEQFVVSERSLVFKKWAQGRCYRCLAHDHLVRSCKAPLRCIRCRGPGHREQFCPSRSSSSSPFVLPRKNHQSTPSTPSHRQLQAAQGTSPLPIEVASKSPLQGKGVISALLDSLKSELSHLFEVQLELMLRPVREELSTIKHWLARLATQSDLQKEDREHLTALNVGELFGPFSPVRLSPTSTLLETLAAECTTVDPLTSEDASVDMVNSSSGPRLVEQLVQKEQQTIQVCVQDENEIVAPTERVFDVELTPDGCITPEDPVVLGVVVEEAHSSVDQMANASSLDLSTIVSHIRKASVKSLSRRSSHSSQHFLKSLGLVTNEGKLDEGKLEEFADLLKDLFPSDLLLSLMKLKGRRFWKAMAKILTPFL